MIFLVLLLVLVAVAIVDDRVSIEMFFVALFVLLFVAALTGAWPH